LLPPPADQARRLAAWNQFWREHSEQFQSGLRAALSERGFAATALTRERYQPRDHIDPVGFTTWDGTPFARIIEQLITEDAGQTRIAAPLPDARDLATVEAAAEILRDNPQAWIASRGQLAGDLVNLVSHDLVRLSGWMALAMALLVWILERSLRAVIAILIPPTLALAWCFGLLGWIGVPLSPFSVMVAAFIAGIGLDNAVFLARIEHRASAIAPVLACTITTMLGVGSLIIANNPILRQNGIALSSGLACCLIACVLLTPLLMDRHPPTKPGPDS
jgi:predicted exporter